MHFVTTLIIPKSIMWKIILTMIPITCAFSQCRIVYVTSTASTNGLGTKASPKTIEVAFSTAQDGDVIRLASGSYFINTTLTLNTKSNLVIEGGFDANDSWRKKSTPGLTTLIRSSTGHDGPTNATRIVAVSMTNINTFKLIDLTITTANAALSGQSTYGLHLNGCSNYSILRCQITSGNGGNGINGNSGTQGASGQNGMNGLNGQQDNLTFLPGGAGAAASGGQGIGGTAGGNGGAGGQATAGANGQTGAGSGGGFGGGGIGGSGCSCSISLPSCGGANGTNGTIGADGSHGVIGNNGVGVFTNYFTPGAGLAGSPGQGGKGGGGGGGGGGQGGICVDGTGGSGGGGGSGGNGGTAGTPGTGGGGSFGIYIFNNGANGNIKDSFVTSGLPGNSGFGGFGGQGGSGGIGGTRGSGTSEVGYGGHGGNGGRGGNGGKGGDGSMGVSNPLKFVSGNSLVTQQITTNLLSLPVIDIEEPIHYTNNSTPTVTANSTATSICAGSPITLTGSGASSYIWSDGVQNGVSFIPTVSTTYTVTGFALEGCADLATISITVNPLPSQPEPFSVSTATVCQNQSGVIYAIPNDATVNYTWSYSGSGTSITGTSNSVTVDYGTTATSGELSVVATNSCGISSARSMAINVNTKPSQPELISGEATICSGSTREYNINSVNGATSYTWNLPSGWSGTSNTTSITTVSSSTGGNITVVANNACGISPAQTLNVSVVAGTPGQPGDISGSNTVCAGSSNTYSIFPVNGAINYTWTMPSGWVGTSTSTSIKSVASSNGGNISVAANNVCGTSPSQTIAVTVPAPAKPVINVNLTNSEAPILSTSGGNSYQWYKNGIEIAGATNSSYTITDGASYTVQAIISGCIGPISDPRVIIVTEATTNDNEKKTLHIYPNPTSDILIISLDSFQSEQDVNITVLDMLGRTMEKTKGAGGIDKALNLEKFQSGPYLIILQQGDRYLTKQILKSN